MNKAAFITIETSKDGVWQEVLINVNAILWVANDTDRRVISVDDRAGSHGVYTYSTVEEIRKMIEAAQC